MEPATAVAWQRYADCGRDHIEFGNAAYRINPVGDTSSPFTAESAYASVRTIDGRRGADISDEELEAMIDEAKARYAQRLIEELCHIQLGSLTADINDWATQY